MSKVSYRFKVPCITPVWVICTYDKEGKPNASTAAWVGMCSSKPPSVAVSFKKVRAAYDNIMERKAFTACIPSQDYVKEVDFCGMVSGRDIDKFAAAGMTPVSSKLVDAPYAQEFPFIIECKLRQYNEIGVHTQFIGEIVDIKVEDSMLEENGLLNINRIKPFFYIPDLRDPHLHKCD